jgi:hypothetical protein
MPDQIKPLSRPWRRFLRFSVRGLIVFVLVIGVWLGWVVRQAQVQRDAVSAINRAGGHITYDIDLRNEVFPWNKLSACRRVIGEYVGIDVVSHVIYAHIDVTPSNNDAACQLALARLGNLHQLKTMNFLGASITDGDLARVAGMKHLKLLMLQSTGITGSGFAHVRALTSLEEILVTDTGIDDDGLAQLRGFTNLKDLTLGITRVTDRGMEYLKELPSLEQLNLSDTEVSDAGLKHLTGLSRLKTLALYNTKVSDAGVRELQNAMPSLTIRR